MSEAAPNTTAEARIQTSDPREGAMSLMMSRVGEVFLHQPHIADGATDLITLCRELAEKGLTEALVQDADQLGIFTTTNLRDAVLMDREPRELQVREVSSFPTIEIGIDEDLHQAMILMLRHKIHRLVVRDQTGRIAGILSQLDLMGFVANNSHLIAAEAARANSISELKQVADQIQPLIAVLRQDGVRVDIIAELVGELNLTVFYRLWELIAPPELREASCLIVMGSEGRSEQIIRTDQDNGLILADHIDPALAVGPAEAFTAALVEFGYPPCPGGIMVTNPMWRRSLSAYRQMIGDWLYGETAEGPMNLAIFMDALAVSGDETLLTRAQDYLAQLVSDSDVYLARFAASMNNFADDSSWWRRLPGLQGRSAAEVDIKKLGIFPIVQGVRALALQHQLPEQNTAARLSRLSALGVLPEPLTRDAMDALRLLMGIKLDNNLRQIAAGQTPGNTLRLDHLATLDRQGLRDALAIVTQFRGWVNRHFRIEQ